MLSPGAAGGIGQPLSMLMRMSPLVSELNLYDVAPIVKGVACDLSHCDVGAGKVPSHNTRSSRPLLSLPPAPSLPPSLLLTPAPSCTSVQELGLSSTLESPVVLSCKNPNQESLLQVTGFCGDAELGDCLKGVEVREAARLMM